MATFESIPGISRSSVELLEATGFLDEASLAKAGLDALVDELARANAMLKLAESTPTRDEVASWIAAARGLTAAGGTTETAPAVDGAALMAVNYEATAEVREMLAGAPLALPLPAKLLVEKRLAVRDIPAAILLNRVVGDLEIRVAETEHHTPPAAKSRVLEELLAVDEPEPEAQDAVEHLEARSVGFLRREPEASPRLDIDVSRVKAVADVASGKVVREPSVAPTERLPEDRVSLIRAPRPETNAGKSPESRWFIRGVMHAHPVHIWFAALATVLMAVLLPLAIVSAALLLISDLYAETFGWVPKWLLVFPLLLPLVGGAYLWLALSDGRCRICSQHLFLPRRVNKNTKAHHAPLLGYIVPTALHLMVFRWFRCSYCGTAVRVKE